MAARIELYQSKIGEGEHLIGAFIGDASGPTLIVVGGIHGNELAGVSAMVNVSRDLELLADKIKGRVYLVAGNTRALRRGIRFIDRDLNRSWTRANMSEIGTTNSMKLSEHRELAEIDRLIDGILITARSEVYVLDLHSTSATGVPFATVGDTLRNREFARKFPVTILLGVEEQLEGTMLEYLNNTGAVTLGFEGGSHNSPETVANHISLIWLALANTGILSADEIPDHETHRKRLAGGRRGSRVVEVRHREALNDGDEFEMDPGYNNFDPISKGQVLAKNRYGLIHAQENGLILMPLYQKLGEDGFFVGRKVAGVWLTLSSLLRRARVSDLIRGLPGVTPDPDEPEKMIVNTKLARFFPLQIFHLLGYRKQRWVNHRLVMTRRKHDSDSPFMDPKTAEITNGRP